jgi:DNA mismatch repair protein MutS
MKSIGIAVCLAQAGFYVPAEKFEYSPYQYLLTRIIGNDNLFKGLSSFAVEMSELRGILKRANRNSLVLGDEICHGTETISAISIVASSIITLEKQNSNFVFATHLHQLSQMDRVTSLEKVHHFHLKVRTDPKTNQLIYDRKLEPGSGDNLYGIEVAKAMSLDSEFIKLSYQIRKEILDIDQNLLDSRRSRYNTKLYLDTCQVCQNKADDTHHIKPQELADPDNYIGSTRKNAKSNLVPLCKNCHNQVHNPKDTEQRLVVNGYVLTSDGIKLDYYYG